jgi:dTMP kinase
VFIAIEGLDGSGGTTQLARLADRLADGEVVRTREPSAGPVGRLLREALAGGELGDDVLPYLFAADRRDHLARTVLPALARGAVVLSDRYYLSSLAYQAPALGLGKVASLNEGFRAPDIHVLLLLPPEVCLARVQARGEPRERFETLERLRRIEQGYREAVELVRARGERVEAIDASGTPEEVHAAVWRAIGWPG